MQPRYTSTRAHWPTKGRARFSLVEGMASVLILVLALHFCPSAAAAAPEHPLPDVQVQALKDLYESTNGDDWHDNSNWMHGDPCAREWYGVQCTLSVSLVMNVHVLDLSSNNLVGSLPESLADLSQLQFLYLNLNELRGPVLPPALFRMAALQKLLLGSNLFEGAIPESIGNLTSLQFLDLSLNRLEGTVPAALYSMHSLTNIYLDNNRFEVKPGHFQGGLSGSISDDIGRLANLTVLHVNMNRLAGTLPPALFSLSALTDLFLGANQFTGTLSNDIARLTALQQLDVSETKISGTLPSKLFTLTDLSYLNVGLNRFTGTVPDGLENMSKLTELHLNSSPDPHVKEHLSGTLPAAVFRLSRLQYLYLSDNKFKGSLPSTVSADLPDLRLLDLSANTLRGTLPADIFRIAHLHTLYVDDNMLSCHLHLLLDTLYSSSSLPCSYSPLSLARVLFLSVVLCFFSSSLFSSSLMRFLVGYFDSCGVCVPLLVLLLVTLGFLCCKQRHAPSTLRKRAKVCPHGWQVCNQLILWERVRHIPAAE
eukprot:TRINITY_DN2693_c0_g1_i1.p1 TRINITY_DN2693_c0_g1~~TRINITY_DN2693_c0_g1_i1.p1  ORF type:complete len:538 (+),score=141.00 TRINITY_DN2693_c0_g1_i1:147-1760(+)